MLQLLQLPSLELHQHFISLDQADHCVYSGSEVSAMSFASAHYRCLKRQQQKCVDCTAAVGTERPRWLLQWKQGEKMNAKRGEDEEQKTQAAEKRVVDQIRVEKNI